MRKIIKRVLKESTIKKSLETVVKLHGLRFLFDKIGDPNKIVSILYNNDPYEYLKQYENLEGKRHKRKPNIILYYDNGGNLIFIRDNLNLDLYSDELLFVLKDGFNMGRVERYDFLENWFIEKYKLASHTLLPMDNSIANLVSEEKKPKKIITEASKKKILTDKLGLTERFADFLDRSCGPLSVWMANKVIEDRKMTLLNAQLPIDNMSINISIERNMRYYTDWVVSIMDWIRVGLNGNLGENKNLKFNDLIISSQRWHDSLDIGGGKINYVEPHDHEIVLDFRNKDGVGFYWVDLGSNFCDEESKRMGHCGRSGYNLYSLREYKKFPGKEGYTINDSHLTASIDDDGTLYQLKGKKNSKPSEKYHQYILPLFYVLGGGGEEEDYLIRGFGSEYSSQQDFKLSDLSDEIIRDLYQNRPELFESRSLKRKLIELGIIEKPNIDYNITLKIDPDDVGYYVRGDYVIRRYTKKDTGILIETYLFETILSGDVWDLWDNYDVDWKSSLEYYVNEDNEKKIYEMIEEFAKKTDDFDEETFNSMELKELIEEYDDNYDIRNAISDATNDAESDDYVNHLYKTLEDCLEEYGEVESMTDEGVVLHIDVSKLINKNNEEWFYEYMDNCDEDIKCVFGEMVYNDIIDKPKFSIDDRWYPDVDLNYFNERLNERLNEI